MDSINSKTDIKHFIEQSNTNLMPPLQIEYEPYVSEVRNYNYQSNQGK